jgi:hypothetical protein
MKILDIITPHETLDENYAQELAKRAGTTIRNTANDVGERFNISWLRRAESQGVSNYIDEMLTRAGKDLKRSPDLADAERVLLDLEKTVKYDRAGKKQFEEIGDTLADALYVRKESSLGGANPIDELERIYRNSPNPPAWMSNSSIQLKRFDPEYLEWLTKSVDAKIVARREVDLAPKAPPKAKTKAQREEEEIADQNRTNRKNRGILEAEKITKDIKKNKTDEKELSSWWKFSKLDYAFCSAEFARICFQAKQRHEDIDNWEKSGDIPADVAAIFPKTKDGEKQVGGDTNDVYEYTDDTQRVQQAATYMRIKITKQWWAQVAGLGSGIFIGKGLIGLGGGTMGKASWLKNFFTPFLYATGVLARRYGGTRGLAIAQGAATLSGQITTALGAISQAGKYMFADYWLSAQNDGQIASKPLTNYSNMLPDRVWASLKVDHVADINQAWASLVAMDMLSKGTDSAFIQQLWGAMIASTVPIQICMVPLLGTIQTISIYFPKINVPPASGPIPGNVTPVNPETKSAPSVQNVPPPENPEVTATSPPAPADTTTPDTTDNNGIKQRKLEETLKYKVLSRMKS